MSAVGHACNGIEKLPDQRSDHKVQSVYFLAVQPAGSDCLPNIKIGESSNAFKRIKDHSKPKHGTPFDVTTLCIVRGHRHDEQSVLRHFGRFLLPNEKETFRPEPDLVDYIRWLRDQHYVWVPDDEQSQPLEYLEHVDASLWLPGEGRVKSPPQQNSLFNEFGPLRMPPRTVTADDFYTNELIISCAKRVMGHIDLDPASHAAANRVVGARRFFTIADNGLSHEWRGRVWCNPPFSEWASWARKIVHEWNSGRIPEMCVLCATRTLTAKYFAPIHEHSDAICILTGRIPFWGGKATSSPDDGHAVFYFGPNVNSFAYEFNQIGNTFRSMQVTA